MLTTIVIKSLSLLTIAAQALILFGILYFFKKGRENFLAKFIRENGIRLALSVAIVATLGSLYFSEVAGFEPCRLCWFQRIFMYPLPVLLGLAWLKKEAKFIEDYVLSLSAIGLTVAIYHNYVYYSASPAFCDLSGSCSTRYFSEFGYVTIPLMSFTAFLAVILLLVFQKRPGRDHLAL